MTLPEFPRLPTDNLYKFVALAGTIIFIIGWVAPAVAADKASEKGRDIVRDLRLLELQAGADSLGMEILELQGRTDTSARFEKTLDSLRLKRDSTARQTIIVMSQVDASKHLQKSVLLYTVIGGILSTVGLVAAIWGFFNWYHKLQKPLDEWVKRHGNPPEPH